MHPSANGCHMIGKVEISARGNVDAYEIFTSGILFTLCSMYDKQRVF